MKYLSALLLLLCGTIFGGHGQPPPPQRASLLRQLTTAPADTNRVRLLSQLVRTLENEDAPQALRYGQQGLVLARQLHYQVGEVALLYRLGVTSFLQKDEVSATRYFQQAVRRAGTTPQAQPTAFLALLGLGRIAVVQQDYAEGQRFFLQALRQFRQDPGTAPAPSAILVYNSLGVLYLNWLNSGRPYPDSIKSLSMHYNRLSLNSLRQAPRQADYALYLNNLGLVHQADQHYDSAEYYHRRALRTYQLLGQPYEAASSTMLLGQSLLGQHHTAEAVALLRSALAAAHRLRSPVLVADCSLGLATALAETGQGLEAYHLAARGRVLNDSLQQAEQRTVLTRLRVQFDTERERSRVRELTQRNRLQQLQAYRQHQYLWWLGSLLLAVAMGLLAAGSLAWRLHHQQQQLARQHAELAATHGEQDRLYALIAHDLRSPVVAFDGLADLLTDYVRQRDMARLLRLGERVRQTASSLRELLDNLLHWALIQRGELTPVLVPVPVSELLLKLRLLYQTAAEAAGVQLLIVEPPLGCVLADHNMTRAIMRNLISNALQATPAGGRITVRATPMAGGQLLLLEVADTGIGMSADELHRVASCSTLQATARYNGRAGLGLRLSFRFAQAQASRLTLHSTPGQGTVATLALTPLT